MNLGLWSEGTKNANAAHKALYTKVHESLSLSSDRKRVLDLGCGSGNVEAYMCPTFGLSITGVTLGSVMKFAADRRCKGLDCQFVDADFHQLPKFSKLFDGGFAIESLTHSNDKQAALTHWSAHLNTGARLVIVDYFLTDKIPSLNEQADLKSWFEGYQFPSVLPFNEGLKAIAELAGFQSISLEDWTLAAVPGAIRLSNISKKMTWFTVPLVSVFSDFRAVNSIAAISRLLESGVVCYGCWVLEKR